jgi:tRNA (cmo5U34)-methyltransferase
MYNTYMSEPFDPVRRFNERAQVYDSEVVKIIPGYGALHSATLHILSTSLPEIANLLVCGAGTGNEAISYAHENPGWQVTGFDIAEQMVITAKAKVKTGRLEDRVRIIHGSVEDVPLESFDAATSLLVKHFIPYEDKPTYLSNIAMRLKPGAKLITADITGHRDDEEFKEHMLAWEAFQKTHRDDVEEIEKTIDRVRRNLPILTESETISMLEQAGFTNVRLFWKNMMIQGYVAEKA